MGEKKKRASRRKCRDCGHFNDLEAAYCSQCGVTIGGRRPGRRTSRSWQPSYLIIAAIIAIVFSVGLVFKIVFSPGSKVFDSPRVYQTSLPDDELIEGQVRLVAANFRCACGGCGELPLVECNCDMPRGALEEKAFIREELMAGHSVEQVIQLVEGKYGLRIPG